MIYVYFVLLGLLLLYLGHNKVKIGSYSRHVTGNGFVIESKIADLLAALLGVMTVSAVFFAIYIHYSLLFLYSVDKDGNSRELSNLYFIKVCQWLKLQLLTTLNYSVKLPCDFVNFFNQPFSKMNGWQIFHRYSIFS